MIVLFAFDPVAT